MENTTITVTFENRVRLRRLQDEWRCPSLNDVLSRVLDESEEKIEQKDSVKQFYVYKRGDDTQLNKHGG